MKAKFGWLATLGLLVGCSFEADGCDPCDMDTEPHFVVQRDGERTDLTDVARIREGATLELTTSLPMGVSASDIQVDGPFELHNQPLTVRALSSGSGALRLADSCSNETELRLVATPAARAEIEPVIARQYFDPLPAALWPNGIGLLPDGFLFVRAHFYDADGNSLEGIGGEGWSGDGLLVDADRPLGDVFGIAAQAGRLGSTAVHVVGNGSLPVELVPSGSIDRLALVENAAFDAGTPLPLGPELVLEQGKSIVLRVFAYDGEGRLLFGGDGGPVTASIGNDRLPATPVEGFPLWGLAGFLADQVSLSGNAPGDARVTVARGGKTIELLVHVTEAAQPQPTSP